MPHSHCRRISSLCPRGRTPAMGLSDLLLRLIRISLRSRSIFHNGPFCGSRQARRPPLLVSTGHPSSVHSLDGTAATDCGHALASVQGGSCGWFDLSLASRILEKHELPHAGRGQLARVRSRGSMGFANRKRGDRRGCASIGRGSCLCTRPVPGDRLLHRPRFRIQTHAGVVARSSYLVTWPATPTLGTRLNRTSISNRGDPSPARTLLRMGGRHLAIHRRYSAHSGESE